MKWLHKRRAGRAWYVAEKEAQAARGTGAFTELRARADRLMARYNEFLLGEK